MKKIYLKYTHTFENTIIPTECCGKWEKQNYYKEECFSFTEKSDVHFFLDIPKDRNKVFLVKGIYNQGDSFGTNFGKVEYTEVFLNKEDALDFKEKIEIINELNVGNYFGLTPIKKENKIKELENKIEGFFEKKEFFGVKYDLIYNGSYYFFPWGDYFDVLERVEVLEIDICK